MAPWGFGGWLTVAVLLSETGVSAAGTTVLELDHEVSSSTTSMDLQAAIDQVKPGGKLRLVVTNDDDTTVVSLDSELVISRSLEIEKPGCSDGSGCPQLVLDGGGATRIFLVLCPGCSEDTSGSSWTTLTLSNLHIRNGTANSVPATGVGGGCVHLGTKQSLIGCYDPHRRQLARSSWLLWPTPQPSCFNLC